MINKILSFVLYKKLTKAIKMGVFRQEKSEALSDKSGSGSSASYESGDQQGS
jgi:hypothetical protein